MFKVILVQLVVAFFLFGFNGAENLISPKDNSSQEIISCEPGTSLSFNKLVRIEHPRLIYPGDKSDYPRVVPNNNLIPAGTLKNNILELSLEVAWSDFFPETDNRPGLRLVTIAEKDKAPAIPAPMIRLRSGTVIHAVIHNTLKDSTITVFGLQQRPSISSDSLIIKPGETKEVRFESGSPGTFMYWMKLGAGSSAAGEEEDQLSGAFIIDPKEGSPPDRVMMINIFSTPIDTALHLYGWLESLTINGKSWPCTELVTPSVGDTILWRVINSSNRLHPMHLHGFNYKVLSKGTMLTDNIYKKDMEPTVVTESMTPYSTMSMKWVASRPGNWLFHCHLSFHVVPDLRLPGAAAMDEPGHGEHMAGLVVGIKIKPGPSDLVSKGDKRDINLFVNEYKPDTSPRNGFSFLPDIKSTGQQFTSPGPVLILKQYQPAFITVNNRMSSATSVHWHGLDLDSWADGVPGWSASDGKSSQIILPGGKFTYQLTLMRPGSFIYHSHHDDINQLSSGIYGPLIVIGENETYDPKTDHIYIVGWKNPNPLTIDELELNGSHEQPAQHVYTGETHRLRLMNIAPAGKVQINILKDGKPYKIKFVAKDGNDKPVIQQVNLEESQSFGVGETADFLFKPIKPGVYTLQVKTNVVAEFWQQTWVVKNR